MNGSPKMDTTAIPEYAPVLIVGGALTGLSSAVFLAWHGVPSVVVERHPALLIHPRLRGLTPRTVELYRQVGLEPAIKAASYASSDRFAWIAVRAETLASEDYRLAEERGETDETASASPCGFGAIDQDRTRRAGAGSSAPATTRHASRSRSSPISGSPSSSGQPQGWPNWRYRCFPRSRVPIGRC